MTIDCRQGAKLESSRMTNVIFKNHEPRGTDIDELARKHGLHRGELIRQVILGELRATRAIRP